MPWLTQERANAGEQASHRQKPSLHKPEYYWRHSRKTALSTHSTVTLLARLRGLSTSVPLRIAV